VPLPVEVMRVIVEQRDTDVALRGTTVVVVVSVAFRLISTRVQVRG
jgi:hypothetical protein